MARSSNSNLIAIILIIVGLSLALWAYQMSGSISSQLSQVINGTPKDKIMILYIGGAASFGAGIFLLLKK